MTIQATYVSGSSFSVAGDRTAEFAAGVRVQADCGADGTVLVTVTESVYAAGVTTVDVSVDDEDVLTANLTGVLHSNDTPESLCSHAESHLIGGRDALMRAWEDGAGLIKLATAAEVIAGTEGGKAVTPAANRQAFLSWTRDTAGKFPGLIPPAYNFFAPDLALPSTTTFTRASTGWALSQAPAVKSYAANLPRFDYDADGNLLGLRIEAAATRLNTIAAAPVAAESVAVTAVAHTVSFFGTGSVVLSGAHSATLAGTGAFPERVSLGFTPTAGTLTLTPSGTVQHLQLEVGSFATSPILGEGSTVARAADVCTAALSGIDFNTAEGTVFISATAAPGTASGVDQYLINFNNGSSNDMLFIYRYRDKKIKCLVRAASTYVATLELATVADDTGFKVAFSWKANSFLASLNGSTCVEDAAGAVPTGLTTCVIGATYNTSYQWGGAINRAAYFPRALTAAQLQAITL